MPSAWLSIADLLVYFSSLIAGANAYCAVHAGTAAASVPPWLDGVHVWVTCLS